MTGVGGGNGKRTAHATFSERHPARNVHPPTRQPTNSCVRDQPLPLLPTPCGDCERVARHQTTSSAPADRQEPVLAAPLTPATLKPQDKNRQRGLTGKVKKTCKLLEFYLMFFSLLNYRRCPFRLTVGSSPFLH